MKDKLIKMFELQDNFNKVVNKDWKNQNYKFTDAIMVEAVEAFDHYGWKWWKHQKTDINQVKMEIVDIWHFAMSELMLYKIFDAGEAADKILWIVNNDYGSSYRYKTKPIFSVSIKQLIEAASIGEFSFSTFYRCMLSIDMTLDELFEMYIAKNVLNKFRQNNGYKTGEYIKIWNGAEDNVVLEHMMKNIDMNDPYIMDKLYWALEAEYKKL